MWILVLLMCFVIYVVFKSMHRPKKFPPGLLSLELPSFTELYRVSSILIGPRHVPILGYSGFLSKKANRNITDLRQFYGDIVGFNVMFQKIVILNSYEAIRDAFKEDNFAGKPNSYLMQLRSNGRYGIVATMGQVWKQNRRITLQLLRDHGFGKSCMQEMIQAECVELAKSIRNQQGKPFEMKLLLKQVTLNVLWNIATGERIDMDDPKIIKLLEALTELHRVSSIANLAMFLPWDERIPPWLVGAGPTCQVLDEVKSLICDVIHSHQATHSAGEESDFIYAFLSRIQQERDLQSPFHVERGYWNLVNIITEFFVGGGESTSDTLNWFMLMMCCYPHIQRKVQCEIDTVIGPHQIIYEDMKRLPYTQAVVCETQRYSSIVTTIFHAAVADSSFRGYNIPRGTTLMANLYAVFRDPKLWEKPNEFYPQHFLQADGSFKHLEYFIPFGLGRRLCIGETIARVQLCLVASHIVQHFHLSLAPHDPTPATDTDSSFFRIAPHFRLVATQRRLCTTSAVESGSINAQPTAAFLNRVTPKGTPKDV